MAKKRSDRERSPFGVRMRLAREAAGLTQLQVKAALNVSQGTLSELEGMSASSGRVVEFARLYGVDPDWLATGAGEMKPQPRLVGAVATDTAGTQVGPPTAEQVLTWLAEILRDLPVERAAAVGDNLAGLATEHGADHRKAALLAMLTMPYSKPRRVGRQ